MNQSETDARHQVELGYLEHVLNELGFPTQLVEKSPQIPYHALIIGLDDDAQGRPRQLVTTFYPVGEETVEHALLLQYFTELPFAIKGSAMSDLIALLPYLNNKVVLGHFGVTEGKHTLHYRYVQTLPRDQSITREAVIDAVRLVSYTPALFEDVLEALVTGDLTVAQAHAQIDAIYAGL
jgi:hypothetical protein